jgi:hypothetical protein
MKRSLKYIAGGAGALLLAAQLHRPVMDNPPESSAETLAARMNPPPSVQGIIEKACADCHSHRTVWPWYSAVAPASWLVAGDVREGRERLNFSRWGTYSRSRQITALNMMLAEVEKGEMPPSQYTLVHREAVLTDAESSALLDWVEAAADSLTNHPSDR